MEAFSFIHDTYLSLYIETGNLDTAYDIYECLEEESLERLRDADAMSEGETDDDGNESVQ
jgi:hypothetical protein